MKKVLIVLNDIRYSAIEVMLASSIEYFRRNDIEPIIFSVATNGSPAKHLFEDTNTMVIFSEYYTYFLSLRLPFPSLKFLFQYFSVLFTLRPICVHVFPERSSFLLCLIPRLLGIRCLRTVCHIFNFSSPLGSIRRASKILQRSILRFIGIRFFAVAISNSLNENKYFLNPNVEVIPCWVHPLPTNHAHIQASRFSRFDNALNIFTLGGYWPYKNYHLILEAIALLSNSHPYLSVHYTQIGSNNEPLVALANSLKISHCCSFLGSIPDDPFKHVRPWSFMVIPSSEEGFCLAAVESFCRGYPALVSDRKCLYDFKSYTDKLFWLDQLSPDELASKLLILSDLSDSHYNDIALALHDSFVGSFSINSIAPKLIKYYVS